MRVALGEADEREGENKRVKMLARACVCVCVKVRACMFFKDEQVMRYKRYLGKFGKRRLKNFQKSLFL